MTTYLKTLTLDDCDIIDLQRILQASTDAKAKDLLRLLRESKQELASASYWGQQRATVKRK